MNWVEDGTLKSKDIDGNTFISLAMIKELFHYDHKRLKEVPWDKLSAVPPHSSERLREENIEKWIALCSEMGGLKAKYGV